MNRGTVRRRLLVLSMAVGGLLAAGACMDWSEDIPCRSDLHCVEGYACGPDGICIPADSDAAVNTDAGRLDGGRVNRG